PNIFLFFQAEDGIRAFHVTGVQTCALPIYLSKIYNDEWMRENRLLEPERLTAGDMLERKDGAAPPLVAVAPDTLVREALSLVTTHDVSHLPVLRDDACVGSIAEGTLMARVIEDPAVLDRPVESLMDAPFPVVDADAELPGLARLLTRQNPAVLVRRDGRITGIVTRYDMVRYLV